MVALSRARAEHEEGIGAVGRVSQRGHREVTDEIPVFVQHGCQGHSARCWNPVGQHPVKQGPGARTGEFVLGEPGGLDESNSGSHPVDLLGHHFEGVGSVKGDLLHRVGTRSLVPQGLLEAVGRAPHGVGFGEAVVDRRGVQRPAGR